MLWRTFSLERYYDMKESPKYISHLAWYTAGKISSWKVNKRRMRIAEHIQDALDRFEKDMKWFLWKDLEA